MHIAYLTGTRAEFGLMTSVLRAISKSSALRLSLYATGMHLMPEFGHTIDEVRRLFPEVKELPVEFRSDARDDVARFAGQLLLAVVEEFSRARPDFVLLAGDRVEMLSVAAACLYLGISVGHVHGGEKTATIDELARHAISKLSHVHFAATEESALRLKKMGEDAWRVHVVGAPALDVILNEPLPSREELCAALGIDTAAQVILLTQHPVSEAHEAAASHIDATLAALRSFDLPVVAIYPHADAGGAAIIEALKKEAAANPRFTVFPSLPYTQFLALQRECAVWVGNSSAAMIEAASFKVPVVNIGTRQEGRQRGSNVIDVGHEVAEIRAAIEKSLHDKSYRDALRAMENPWGDGKTGERIARLLEGLVIDQRLIAKRIAY